MAAYVIDWDKVKDFEDLKRILEALDMQFNGKLSDFPQIADLLIPDVPPGLTSKYKA